MKTVLVVDDSPSVRQQVGQTLQQAGYQVIEAADGIEGRDAIAARPDISLVLCDINMPRLGGLDMLEQVKREHNNAALPIVMLTTEGQPEMIQRARKAGAKGWIVKPFKAPLLIQTVDKLTS